MAVVKNPLALEHLDEDNKDKKIAMDFKRG